MACGGGGGGDGVGVGVEWEGETGVRVMGGMRADQLFHIHKSMHGLTCHTRMPKSGCS